MSTIQIEVTGTDLEIIAISLTDKEVASIYQANKDLKEQVKKLEKDLESQKSTYKYVAESRDASNREIEQANVLLTALGVQVQNNEEESYRKANLPVATRIALYIAANK
jgi:septal ring factor EnvC (AmiA/AmiB activator)